MQQGVRQELEPLGRQESGVIEDARPDPRSIEEMASRAGQLIAESRQWHPVKLREAPGLHGWAGLDLPQRVGGAEWSARDVARLFRECGRFDVELRDLIGAGHARLLTLAPTRKFDGFLSAVAGGKAYCAIAITEPKAGSDLHALSTVAEPVDGGYRLRGTKAHISRLDECSHIIVYAMVKRETPTITAFLVPRHAADLAFEAMSPMGMATVSWGRLHLRNVRVPIDARVGGEGAGLSLFMRHFSYWRVMMAAAAIGSAQAAVDSAVERMKDREAFGGPIGRFSHLQLGLAQHVAKLRMAWLLVEDVASQIDTRTLPMFDAAMAKAEAIEAAVAAVEWAMNVFGAAGYDSATGLEKRYRDLAGLRVADGTTDVLRGQVARAVLGDRLYELSLNRKADHRIISDLPRRSYW